MKRQSVKTLFLATGTVAASAMIHMSSAALWRNAPDVKIEGAQAEASVALGSGFETLVAQGDRLEPTNSETARVETPVSKIVEDSETSGTAMVPAAASERFVPNASNNLAFEPVAPVPQSNVTPPSEIPLKPEASAAVASTTDSQRIAPTQPALRLAPVMEKDVPDQAQAQNRKAATAELPKAKKPKTVNNKKPAARPDKKPGGAATPSKSKSGTKQKPSGQSAANEGRQGRQTGRDNTNTKAGASEGNSGKASAESTGKGKSAAGNATASNYQGKVFSKIRRTRQRAVGGRGVATVSFTINSNGALVSISLAASSGNSTLDAAALDHIRRAAPFPKPPARCADTLSNSSGIPQITQIIVASSAQKNARINPGRFDKQETGVTRVLDQNVFVYATPSLNVRPLAGSSLRYS
ncbi:MAG: energy transducer TonB [Sphingopyxis sp.]|nr:energy transducer TonB [Sphingopyxis sp.]